MGEGRALKKTGSQRKAEVLKKKEDAEAVEIAKFEFEEKQKQ